MSKQCTCPITPGMSYFQLRALGAGCTVTYVCPTLDARRRAVRQPTELERGADDIATYKEVAARAEEAL